MRMGALYRRIGHHLCLLGSILVSCQLLLGCDMARMKDDEAFQTYQHPMPPAGPKHSIPVSGGLEVLRQMNPDDLTNPLPASNEVLDLGKTSYTYYCIQCHGPNGEGYGTVGQSFAPLPFNLASSNVQRQSDGTLYYKINLGSGRHPALWETVAPDESWAIIRYLRFLGKNAGTEQG